MEYKLIAPGVLVSTGFTVKIPHPDPCWIVHSGDDPRSALSTSQGRVLIFSTDELARSYLMVSGADVGPISEFKFVCLTWDQLVDTFGTTHFGALVDHGGKSGFYAEVPLEKNI